MHHIISDGWSMDVLVREVATLYAAFVEGSALAAVRNCRFSTLISPPGNRSGCVEVSLKIISSTGRSSCQAHRPYLTCQPINRVQQCRSFAAPMSNSPYPNMSPSNC